MRECALCLLFINTVTLTSCTADRIVTDHGRICSRRQRRLLLTPIQTNRPGVHDGLCDRNYSRERRNEDERRRTRNSWAQATIEENRGRKGSRGIAIPFRTLRFVHSSCRSFSIFLSVTTPRESNEPRSLMLATTEENVSDARTRFARTNATRPRLLACLLAEKSPDDRQR